MEMFWNIFAYSVFMMRVFRQCTMCLFHFRAKMLWDQINFGNVWIRLMAAQPQFQMFNKSEILSLWSATWRKRMPTRHTHTLTHIYSIHTRCFSLAFHMHILREFVYIHTFHEIKLQKYNPKNGRCKQFFIWFETAKNRKSNNWTHPTYRQWFRLHKSVHFVR